MSAAKPASTRARTERSAASRLRKGVGTSNLHARAPRVRAARDTPLDVTLAPVLAADRELAQGRRTKLDHQRVERAYAGWARIYDRIFGPVFQDSRERAIRNLGALPGQRILEVGVGTGLLLPLYPADCRVVGIDLSEAMLAKARERVRKLGLKNLELHAMDAGQMTFPDSSFDIVMAAYVVTAVPEYKKVIREMVRVCRPGGRIIMLNHLTSSNPVLAAVERAISPLCTHIGFRTDLSLSNVLDGAPLRLERHEKVRPLRMWHLVECRNAKLAVA